MPLISISIQQALADSLAAAQTTPPEGQSFLDVLALGGWVMIPIILLSVVAIYLFVERLVTIQRAKIDPREITDRIRNYVHDGDIQGALHYCDRKDVPITHILRHGLERLGRPIAEIQDAVQAAGKYEAFELEKRTSLLATIAGIAPMLGFFGTVSGMIEAFQDIQRLQGNVNPSVLAGGIWEALLTTAAGLIVGILALFFYNFLLERIGRLVNDMERSATDFIDLLQEPAASPGARRERVESY